MIGQPKVFNFEIEPSKMLRTLTIIILHNLNSGNRRQLSVLLFSALKLGLTISGLERLWMKINLQKCVVMGEKLQDYEK